MDAGRKQGHALTDLLVVIAIIIIIAAILFPLFAQPSNTAMSKSCRNNEKQISAVITMYAGSFDSLYPPEEPCKLQRRV